MPIDRYIKQPLALSLPQYVDLELRKIESAIFSASEFSDSVQAEVDALQVEIALLDHWTTAIKPADQSIANDNTINADADLVIPLGVGFWDIECVIAAICAVSAIAIAFDFEHSGTVESPGMSIGPVANAIRVFDSAVPHTPGSASTMSLVANVQKGNMFRGVLRVLTTGNLTFYWSQGASNATPVILRKGSFLRARQIA